MGIHLVWLFVHDAHNTETDKRTKHAPSKRNLPIFFLLPQTQTRRRGMQTTETSISALPAQLRHCHSDLAHPDTHTRYDPSYPGAVSPVPPAGFPPIRCPPVLVLVYAVAYLCCEANCIWYRIGIYNKRKRIVKKRKARYVISGSVKQANVCDESSRPDRCKGDITAKKKPEPGE